MGVKRARCIFTKPQRGKRLSDTIPRVQGPTAGGSAAWNAENSGIFYTRYPRPGERSEAELSFYQQVFFHRVGTPSEQDRYELGKEFPRIAEIQLQSSPDGRYTLATVANGDGGEYAHYLRAPTGEWRQITKFEDQVTRAEFGRDPLYIEAGKDNAVYLLSHKNAPRGTILRMPFAQPALSNAEVIVAERTNVIQDFKPAASGVYLKLLNGGPSEIGVLRLC
jgi:prolyl oligopeptidase